MRLLAISDLHLKSTANREALAALPAYPDDWLICAGDVAEALEEVEDGLRELTRRFARVIWVPGNHELYSRPARGEPVGEAKYRALVEVARRLGVDTPEDPFPVFPSPDRPTTIAPLFLLYDYSFRPADVTREGVDAWAAQEGIFPADERLLSPDPFESREAWCWARVESSIARLNSELPPDHRVVLVNHWTLRGDLVRIPRIPRFRPWCGTKLTEDWHNRFNAEVVVTGHLHLRATDYRNDTRFEEVSLGYPKNQWRQEHGLAYYLREIVPGPGPMSPLPLKVRRRFYVRDDD